MQQSLQNNSIFSSENCQTKQFSQNTTLTQPQKEQDQKIKTDLIFIFTDDINSKESNSLKSNQDPQSNQVSGIFKSVNNDNRNSNQKPQIATEENKLEIKYDHEFNGHENLIPNNNKNQNNLSKSSGCCSCFPHNNNQQPNKNSQPKTQTSYDNKSIPDISDITNCYDPEITDLYPKIKKNPNDSDTFEPNKNKKGEKSLRKDENTFSDLNLDELAYVILTLAKKGEKSYSNNITNSELVTIRFVLVFKQSYLSLSFQYKQEKYILCAQITNDEDNLFLLSQQFNEQYEDNRIRIILTARHKNEKIKFFVAKVNKKIINSSIKQNNNNNNN